MFGILEKMDRFSNNLMEETEKVNFIQEIIDNKMVWDMAQKYQDAAIDLIGRGLCTSPLPLWADPIDKLAQSLSDAGVTDVDFLGFAAGS
jgi:hypothetical protein